MEKTRRGYGENSMFAPGNHPLSDGSREGDSRFLTYFPSYLVELLHSFSLSSKLAPVDILLGSTLVYLQNADNMDEETA